MFTNKEAFITNLPHLWSLLFVIFETLVMTLLLVAEALENEAITLTDTVTVSSNAASMGGSQIFIKEGERKGLVGACNYNSVFSLCSLSHTQNLPP